VFEAQIFNSEMMTPVLSKERMILAHPHVHSGAIRYFISLFFAALYNFATSPDLGPSIRTFVSGIMISFELFFLRYLMPPLSVAEIALDRHS
jgi:hypothetical protein